MSPALTSDLLSTHGFKHGFSLRTGGASVGAYASLNLGRAVGDDLATVRTNLERFAYAVGYHADALYEVSQMHGRIVRSVSASDDVLSVRREEGDALVTRTPQTAIGVRIADCVPLLVADLRTGAVAAIHAGWRGVVARVVDAALDALLLESGSSAEDLVVAIGPHIRAASFEVGEDVAQQIAGAAPRIDVVRAVDERWRADLALAIRAQLAARGILASFIDDVGGDTFAEPDRFFSHRRDHGTTGRHLAVIVSR